MFISSEKFLLFYVVFLLSAVFERITSTFFHKKSKLTIAVYYSWAFTLLFYTYLFIVFSSIGEFLVNLKEINLSISAFGVMIYGCGVFLRRKAISDLGDNWSVYIEIKERHELITSGIYSVLRHPYCLAVFFELTGACFIANAFYSLILVFFIQGPLLLIRIILEEKILSSYFGNAYGK